MEKIKKLEEISNKLLIPLLFILIFSDYLGNNIHKIFFYFDEIILILITAMILYKLLIKKEKILINKEEKWIAIAYAIIYISGITGNIISGYQKNIMAIIIDGISWLKFLGVYICIINLIKENEKNTIYELLIKLAKSIIIISIAIAILNLFCDFMGDHKYGKFGIPAFTYGGHPYFAAAILACTISILTTDVKKNLKYIICGCILSILTFRTKAYIYVALITLSYILLRKKINFWKISIIAIVMIIIGWGKISYYFLDTTSSRATLLITSFKISRDFFPIGSGLATFGTLQSGENFSKAYEVYQLNYRYGFLPNAFSFVTDCGWAGIIGQFGIIGTLCYLFMFYCFGRSIYRFKQTNNMLPFIGIIGYLLISSTNENAFTSNYTIFFAIILAIIVMGYKEKS